jgi:UDP-glucose 4-epimerase
MQSRDFTYIENVVEANLLAAEASGAAGSAFNIACGGRYTLLDLLDRLKGIIGSDTEPIHEAARAGDVRDSQASIEAAEKALGYRVLVDFEEGLSQTVEWFKNSRQ